MGYPQEGKRPAGADGMAASRQAGPGRAGMSYSDAYSRFHSLSRRARYAVEWRLQGAGSARGDGPSCLTTPETEAADGDAAAAPDEEAASATALSASLAAKCFICRSSAAKSRRTSSRHVMFRPRAWKQHTRDKTHMLIVCVAQALRNSHAQRGGTLNAEPQRCQQAISLGVRKTDTTK